MKKRFILPLIGMLAFSLTACGTKGDTGPQGPQGEQGVAGQNGQDGIDGNDGQDAVQYIPAIFNNYDGTMLYTFYYEKGSTIVYDGPEPTRDGYVQDGDHYIYEFTGWDKSLENIQVPTIFTAQYELRNVTKEYNISIGKIPNLSEDGETITYGLYPTNNINNNEELVAALDDLAESGSPEANGYYLYNDQYYAKTVADLFTYASKTFANGIEITNGETYWFECEPITWNVLDDHNGEYVLLSSIVLDQCCYHPSFNNNKYKDSYVRTWINEDFYNSAFILDNSYIQTTIVDNSASTTASETNPYACEDTEDNVFLLSYQDCLNNDYGFPSSTSECGERVCPTTDWAKARGICIYSDETNGRYWTRSPSEETEVCAMHVSDEGTIFYENTNRKFGVRPAITIKIV